MLNFVFNWRFGICNSLSRYRIWYIVIALLLFGSLGPYLTRHIRLDNVLSLVIAICVFPSIFKATMRVTPLVLFFLLTTLAACAAAVVVLAVDFRIDTLSDLLGVFRLFTPVVILIPFVVLERSSQYTEGLFWYAVKIVTIAGCVGSVMTLLTMLTLPHFVQDLITGYRESCLWHETRRLGRYTGVFMQPLEAGVFFTCALISVNFQFLNKKVKLSNYIFTTALISVSGFLSLSKNFYLLGYLTVFLMASLFGLKQFLRVSIYTLPVAISSGIIAIVGASPNYTNSLISLYRDHGLIAALSGGRFSLSSQGINSLAEGGVPQRWEDFWLHGFWSGVRRQEQLPFDNAYLEYALKGGILSLLFYVASLMFMFFVGIKNIRSPYGKLMFSLSVFAVLSSFGGPVFAANRANILALALVAFSFVAISYSKKPASII